MISTGSHAGTSFCVNCSTRSRAKRNSNCSATSKTASVAASTRTRSSSLAAISADSARSNAESIAEIFTGAELNRGKSVYETGCQPVASKGDKIAPQVRDGQVNSSVPRNVRVNVLSASREEAGSSEI